MALEIANGKFDRHVLVNFSSTQEIEALASIFKFMARKLTQVEEIRREFVANVSHELRSPITFISGVFQGLESKTIPNDQRQFYINAALNEIQRISRLVQDLLDLSRIEEGALKLSIQRVDLNELALQYWLQKNPQLILKKLP